MVFPGALLCCQPVYVCAAVRDIHLAADHRINPSMPGAYDSAFPTAAEAQTPQPQPQQQQQQQPGSIASPQRSSGGGGGGGVGGIAAAAARGSMSGGDAAMLPCPNCGKPVPDFEELQVHMLTDCVAMMAD